MDNRNTLLSTTVRRGPVELWCASLDRWVQGFEVVHTDGAGHVVRRCSDGSVLPVRFGDDDVRPVPDGGR